MTHEVVRALCTVAATGALVIGSATHVRAQPAPSTRDVVAAARAHHKAHAHDILRELQALVELPNVAANRADIARNATALTAMLERRRFRSRLLTTDDAAPVVYGERSVPGASRTVVFYAHYDGQPVDASQWTDPPWTATLRTGPTDQGGDVVPWDALPATLPAEARLYGRSSSDDKGPIVAFLAAVDALAAAKTPPSVNLKVFLEGEEEAGSPHLERVLRTYADLLRADLWIFGDGPVHQSRRPLVSFGVRGTIGLDLTLFGPARALHSGHYGNWAPNPAAELATLLASVRDDDGRIRIDGFAEKVRPLDPLEEQALAALPDIDTTLAHDLALGRTERVRGRLAESITQPALNVRGLRAGAVGESAANAIPVRAQASIDFRLVPDLTPADVTSLVEAHLERLGYHIVHAPPPLDERRRHPRLVQLTWDTGYPAYRTSLTLPVSQALVRIVSEATGQPVVRMPTMGGSLPLYLFAEVLSAPIITVPIVNHDNNQHAANENLRVQNLWDGIEIYAALIAGLGTAW